MTKKSTRRDKYKYRNVEPSVNLKSRQDDIQDVQSYFNTLSDADKEWMNKFMGEYNNASGVADDDTSAIHNTQELRKACRDRNNQRNSDVYTREKARNNLKYVEKNEDFENLAVDVFSKEVKKPRSKKKKKLH